MDWKELKKRPIHIGWIALGLSILNLALYNIPFFQFVANHSEMNLTSKLFLFTTLIIVMLALNFSVFYIFMKCLRHLGRGMIGLTFILSATSVYFINTYHVIMDTGMISNVFNTRYSEASGFFCWSLWLHILLFGVLPAVITFTVKLKWGSWKQMGKWCGTAMGGSLVLVLLNLGNVLWIGKYDTELGGLLMPWGYIVNTCRLISHNADKNKKEILLPEGKFKDQEKTAVVLVIGESARRANFELYGYERPTNPRLKEVEDLQILMAHSNATYTTEGVFSILEPKDKGKLYEILPNYVYRCGGDVAWRTSNWGEPPVHIKEYVKRKDIAKAQGIEKYQTYDGLLFEGIGERIRQSQKNKVLIVLHTSTGHGPDYQLQYPKEFELFTPVCSRVEDAQNEPENLRNAYDNTIVYTDYLLRNLVDTLRSIEEWKTAMLYISDHGESLGENGIYMHGLPKRMAPSEQYEIPLLIWTNKGNGELKKQQEEVDQFHVFHTVLGWLGIESDAYDSNKDLFSRQRKK